MKTIVFYSVMTTLLFLALLNRANDIESVKETTLMAKRENVQTRVTNLGLPALEVLLQDIEDTEGTLGRAEIRAGRNLWKRSLREGRSPGFSRDSDLGQVGGLGGKFVDMKMRVIRNSPETG